MSGPLVLGSVSHSPDFKARPSFSPALAALTAKVMETPAPKAEPSTPSGRYESLSYEAGDLALRHGALQARASQLSALVDELLENLAEIRFDCPRLVARVKQANEAAKKASGL